MSHSHAQPSTGQEQPAGQPAPTPQPPQQQPPAPPQTFTQDELNRIATREKEQGRQAGVNALAAQFGFADADQLQSFIAAQQAAAAAQLTEQQRHEQEVAQRDQQTRTREQQLAARERDLNIRGALAVAGAFGDEQDDAAAILQAAVPANADAAALATAVTELKTRRPALFATAPPAPPAAPGTLQSMQQPHQPPQGTPGQAGRDRASERFGQRARVGQ